MPVINKAGEQGLQTVLKKRQNAWEYKGNQFY